MNTKKSKKSNSDHSPPGNNNYKKKPKNIVSVELENNVGAMKKKEHSTSFTIEDYKTPVKAGKKRSHSEGNLEYPYPKKSRKKTIEEANLEEESTPSSTKNSNKDEEVDVTPTPKKAKKKKTKVVPDGQSFIITDQNGGSINILEMSIQQNGKRKDESNQDDQQNSFDDDSVYKSDSQDTNSVNDIQIKHEPLREDNSVNLTVRDLEDTDSEINENDITVSKLENIKGAKKGLIDWPKDDLKKLVERMEACIPENDVLAFSTRAEKLQWDTIAFKDYTVEDCRKMWLLLQKQIRRFRLLKEVLVDAKEWIDTPKARSKKPARHPDMPRKPLSAYFIYYMKKRDMFHKSHPGLDATEISKILAQDFKSLPPERRLKYEKLAAKKREEYDQQLAEFYQTHPDIPRIVRTPKTTPQKPPKLKIPKSPKTPKPVKEKPPPKTPKERIPKRPPPPFQYYYLSELEKEGSAIEDKVAFKEVCKDRWKEMSDKKKLVWINYAETEYAKYEEALQQYIQSHPDYAHNVHKPILTKEEIQIKERVAGKPSKPPGSAYNLFARMLLQSEEIKAVPIKDRLNYVSNKWKICAEEEKKQYRDLSAQLIEKYKLEFASYLETLPEEERKRELQKIVPKRRKSEEVEKKVSPSKQKRSERKSVTKKLVEPEQPPISAFKYFATLYTGEEPVAQAWKALTPEQKKIYEDELVKKKQAYIANFEKFLKSLTKEELEAFSNSRRSIKKDDEEEEEEEEEEEDSSDDSGTEDSDPDSNDQDEDDENDVD